MISAVIITLNEAHRLERCLAALEGVADEIIVMDTGSTDGTLALAEQLGARVMRTDWKGFAQTKNLANQAATQPYILSIDADEVLSPGLRNSILAEKQALKGVYQVSRLTHYIGTWIRHGGWYPDRKVRLFPAGQAHWEGAYVHERLVYDQALSVRTLQGDLLHYSIDSVSDHWQRIAQYNELKAQALYEANRSTNFWHMRSRAWWKFVRMYLLKQGFRDGQAGWQLARLSAAGELLKWARLYELQHSPNSSDS